MYAHLITVTGWTWEYIDTKMTLPRLAALQIYWHQNPPTHTLMKAFVGAGKVTANTQTAGDQKDGTLADVASMFGMTAQREPIPARYLE